MKDQDKWQSTKITLLNSYWNNRTNPFYRRIQRLQV